MTTNLDPRWLGWAQRLQAIAQDGLTYGQDVYDRERYELLQELAAEIYAEGSGAPLKVIRGLFAEQAGYATPKVDVRGAAFRDGRVLLVQERSDGLWTLPGGFADPGFSPTENVEREMWEESGFTARAVKLALVHERARHTTLSHAFSIYKLCFVCELTGGAAQESVETAAVGFFAPDALPPLSEGRMTAAQLERMFVHWRNPDLPTEFD